MGNTQTCTDCSTEVPKTVRFFDRIWNGRTVYNYFTEKLWVKTGNDYLCPDCLVKRQEKVRMEERKQEEAEKERRKTHRNEQREEMREQRRRRLRKQKCKEIVDEKYKGEQDIRTNSTSNKTITSWLKERKKLEIDHFKTETKMQIFRQHFNPDIDISSHESICTYEQPKLHVDTSISFCLDIGNNSNENIQISLRDIYMGLCDMSKRKHLDMSKCFLMETCQSILMQLQSKCRISSLNIPNISNVVQSISQFSYNDAMVILLVLLCVHAEQFELKTEMHTCDILKQYCLNQNLYKDEKLTEKSILRKLCDVLALLKTDSSLSKVRKNIDNIFDHFYSTLRSVCFENKNIKSSLDLISTQKTWEFEDLIYLLWLVQSDEEKGEQILHLIFTFGLQPFEMMSDSMTIKKLLLTWNSKRILKILKLSCKEESHKTLSDVLDEMENSGSVDSKLKSEIRNVLEEVYTSLENCGYPGELRQNWNVLNKIYSFSNNDECRQNDRTNMQELLQTKQIKDMSDEELSICIAEICRSVKTSKGFWPRCTQLASLCILMKSYKKGCLLEINTGEGKTCIVAMFAVFLALSGISVDIISSSPLLAQRDSVEWSKFYKEFNISVGSNLTQNENQERLECYQMTVVYGTVGSFASDILRQEFLMENVRGDRKFNAVIVDEVDCLLLDQGMNCTYLSNASPGMHHLEPILLMIWNEVIRHPVIKSDQNQRYFLGKAEPFHVFLSSLINLPTEYDGSLQILHLLEMAEILPKTFTSSLVEIDVTNCGKNNTYRTILTKIKLFECFQWIQSHFDIFFEIYDILDGSTIQIAYSAESQTTGLIIKVLIVGEGLVCGIYEDKDTLCALMQSKIERIISRESHEQSYSLPSYLLKFAKNRLPTWINNAFTAKYMTPGREYLIDDKTIVPVDFESTGVVELDTKWGDGLHQFLEIKHKKRLSQMTIVTNFMSNQAFFKRYPRNIYGVSGTLGNSEELSYIQRTFGLKSSVIPTIRRKRHSEIPGVVCGCKKEWFENILTTVEEQISKKSYRNKRAVLIICEDINTTEEIKACLKPAKYSTLSSYTGNNTDDIDIDKKLCGGDVIVATNIAGRGTDIEVDDSVVGSGGLFVLATFLPQNKRVEKQVFGRSARKGQCGSSQIIVNKECLPPHLQIYNDIKTLKIIRDEIEQKRMTDIEHILLPDIRNKENLFSLYCSFVQNDKELCMQGKTQRQIMLSSMHEFWGLWLKMKSDNIGKQNFEEVKKELSRALSKARTDILRNTSPCSNIYHIVKFANEKLYDPEFNEAEKLFTQAIECDKEWAAIAYYNRAYCHVKQQKEQYIDKALADLNAAEEGFCKYKEEVTLSLSLIGILPRDTNETRELSDIELQFQTRYQILMFFEENVKTSLQKLSTLKKDGKNVEAMTNNVFTYPVGREKLCKKIDSEMYVFWELGMTDIVSIDEKLPFCWKGLLVAILGVLQIAVGSMVIAGSVGSLTNIGWGLVTEGINDICTGAYAVYKRDQNFVKTWLTGKAVSIAISIATVGFNQVKMASKGTKGVKATASAINAQIKSESRELFNNFVKMPSNITSKSVSQALKRTCKEVAVHTGKKLAERAGEYLVDVAKTDLQKYFEKDLRKRVTCQVEKEMNGQEMKDILENYVHVLIKESKDSKEINDTHKQITENLLTRGNTRHLGPILSGCVVCIVKQAQSSMKEENSQFFEKCKPLMGMIIASHSLSHDVEKLVTIYCSYLVKTIDKLYGNKFTDITEEDMLEKCERKEQVKSQLSHYTINHLSTLIINSFNSISECLLSENLQKVVGGIVSDFDKDSIIGKETIQNICSISQNGARLVESIKTKDRSRIIESGIDLTKTGTQILFEDAAVKKRCNFALDVAHRVAKCSQSPSKNNLSYEILDTAKDGIETFMSGESKQQAKCFINTTKTVISTIGNDSVDAILQAATSIAEDGIDTFTSGEIKEKAKFAVSVTRQGVKSVKSGDAKEMFKTSLNLAEEGVDKFASDEIKEKAKFAVSVTRQGVKSVKSGDAEEMFKTSLNLAEEGVDKFASDEIKEKAKFAVSVTRQGVKAVKSGDAEEMFQTSLKLVEEGVDKFASDEIKENAKFAVSLTRQGVKSVKSGDAEEMFQTSLNLIEEGVAKFASDEIKEKAKFAVSVTRQGVKSGNSGDAEEMFQTSLNLVEEGVDKFSSDEMKEKAKFAVSATRREVKSVKSGDAEDMVQTSLNLVEEGVDKFASDEIKEKAKFAVSVTRQGVKAVKSGDAEEMFQTSLKLVEEGVDKFASDEIKENAKFAVSLTRQGVKSVKSGDAEEMFQTSLNLIEEGVAKFASDEIKEKAKFAVSVTRQGVKSGKSGDAEEMFQTSLNLVEEGVDKFASDEIKEKAKFAVSATRREVKSVKSGDTEQEFSKQL